MSALPNDLMATDTAFLATVAHADRFRRRFVKVVP